MHHSWDEDYGRLSRRSPEDQRVPHSPAEIYAQAQVVDAWPGEEYDGTSVMAAIREHFRSHPGWRPTPAWLVPAPIDMAVAVWASAPTSTFADPEAASPDAMVVRFSEMSSEAEAEMAAWDNLLHGR